MSRKTGSANDPGDGGLCGTCAVALSAHPHELYDRLYDGVSGLLIGYARVTTDAQDLAAQREVLAALGVSAKRVGRSTALDSTAHITRADRPSPLVAISLVILSHALWFERMTARVRLRSADDCERELPFGAVRAGDLRAAVPWRTFRSHRNQRHYSGWYWSSTVADHVVYESRLELARLLLADADPDVVGIVAQPFLLIEGFEAKPRRHVPDFFLEHRTGLCTVVNVKPARRLNEAKVTATLAWAGEAVEAKGWEAEVWTGCDPLVLANVRFLAGYRRSWLFDRAQVEAAAAAIIDGDTFGGLERRLRAAGVVDPRALVLHLLWTGRARVDLASPLGLDTAIGAAA